MPREASHSEVRSFLTDFKRAMASGKGGKCIVWSRDKNWSALAELGLSERQRDAILMALRPEDYSAGPMPDDAAAREGDVWIFGVEIHGVQVYIKLKLVGEEPLRKAICASFHPAKWPMSFPLRD